MSKPPSRYALLELLARALPFLELENRRISGGELARLIEEIKEVAGEVDL